MHLDQDRYSGMDWGVLGAVQTIVDIKIAQKIDINAKLELLLRYIFIDMNRLKQPPEGPV